QVDEITLRPLSHQPSESFWKPLTSRLNHFQIPAEEATSLTDYLNDSVIMHEPFFQQSPSSTVKQELQITSVEAVAFFQNSNSIPKLFDMRNRSDGIVIRDSMDMEDYLEPNSSESPLLKSTETVLQELESQDLDPEALMDEQRAIEADLQTQQLIDPATRLLQASNAIPEDLKSGLPLGDTTISMLTDKGKQPVDQESKTRARKRQASLTKQESRKKQHSEEARVEAANPKWLPADK
ncbi:hypothetical protein LINGRAHAP2_LOCUS5152, partial [Linum grandiflorum]